MAVDVFTFKCTLNINTTPSAPQTINLTMPPRNVTEVRIRIPPGPRGEVGFALGQAGVRVYPFSSNDWQIGDNETISIPITDGVDSGAWQLQGYNTGKATHTLWVTFLCDLIDMNARSAPLIISHPKDVTSIKPLGASSQATAAAKPVQNTQPPVKELPAPKDAKPAAGSIQWLPP